VSQHGDRRFNHFAERAVTIDLNGTEACQLLLEARLSRSTSIKVGAGPAPREKARSAGRLVNGEMDHPVKARTETGTTKGDRLNNEESDAPSLRRPTRLINQCSDNWPLELFKARQRSGIGKRSRRKKRCINRAVRATRLRNGLNDGCAQIGGLAASRSKDCISINVLCNPSDRFTQRCTRGQSSRNSTLP
jgi:hypothetical protein